MEIWHLTPDTPRFPYHVSGSENVNLTIGTWPVEPGQGVWIEFSVAHADGSAESGRSEGTWIFNRDANSHWFADFGPFRDGDRVEYRVRGESGSAKAEAGPFAFHVGPKIHLALLWHQHQPLYRNVRSRRARGSYVFPWVRLHSLRDRPGRGVSFPLPPPWLPRERPLLSGRPSAREDTGGGAMTGARDRAAEAPLWCALVSPRGGRERMLEGNHELPA